jgi:hypothetical protein
MQIFPEFSDARQILKLNRHYDGMKKIPEFFTILGLIILSTGGYMDLILYTILYMISIRYTSRPQYIHMLWITLGHITKSLFFRRILQN